ncbi:MAG: hypothetical protein JW904_04765 [Spirochaetales bacterium]|nr:hypothetical protein [Spirochaetales bacterium]
MNIGQTIKEVTSMAIAEKVYDFKVEKVKSQVMTAFKKRKNESTISDLVTATGLPKYQVEQTTKLVCDEYCGHMKVTESGEILYYFPSGMKSRYRGAGIAFKRFFKSFFSVMGKILTVLFKIWIMLMLVVYFLVFLAIIVLAIAAAIAASASSKSRSRRGGAGGMMFLVLRLLQLFLRIFFWVQLTKDSREKPKGRAFYKSVFGYVFGDEDPNKEFNTDEKIQILSFIRSNKGVITTEELMALTGHNYSASQALMNTFLVEFEGEPMVTDDGTLFFFFPELLRTSKKEMLLQEVSSISESKQKKLIPFSGNKGKSNGIITFFNGFNLLFGLYFTVFSLIGIRDAVEIGFGQLYVFVYQGLFQELLEVLAPHTIIFIGLGVVPLVFSTLMFLVPIIRNIVRIRKNEKIKQENLSKKLYTSIYYNPVAFLPASVRPGSKDDSPKNADQFVIKATDRFAGDKHAEIEVTGDNKTVYNFEELHREIKDIAGYRQTVNTAKYEVGETVFDSNADA